MSGDIEGIGAAVTAGLAARAVEPQHGGPRESASARRCLNCGTSLTGSQAIGTNVLSMLKGSAFGMECAWLRCWNVYTSDGSIPSETPLIDEGPDPDDVNASPYKAGAASYT